MSGVKSTHMTPATVFGARVRQLREERGWSQVELARRLNMDRTTLNKIERGSRGDVSITQLFRFARVLKTAPVHLITPREGEARIELEPGSGETMSASSVRQWVRGAPPPDSDEAELIAFFLDLPRDEQLAMMRTPSERSPSTIVEYLVAGTSMEAVLNERLALVRDALERRKKEGSNDA